MAFYDSDSDGDSAFDDPHSQAMELAIAHWRARGATGRRSPSTKGSFPASLPASFSPNSFQAPSDVRALAVSLHSRRPSPTPTPQQPHARPRLVMSADGQLLSAHSTALSLSSPSPRPLTPQHSETTLPRLGTMKSLPPLPPALRGHSDSPQQHQPSRNVRPVASSSELFQRLRHFRSMLSFSGSGHNPSTSNVSTPSSSVSQEKGPTHRTSTWSLFAMKRAATTHSASLRKERSQNQSSMHQRSHFNENSSNSRYELRRGVSFGADSAVMYRTISATSRITNSPLASSNSRRTTVTATTSMSSKSYTTSGIPTPVLTSHSPATNHARSSHHPFDALRDATTRIGERQRHAGRELRRLSGNLFGSSSNHNDRNPIHPAPPPPDTWPWVIEESPRSSVRQRRSFDLWMNPSRGRNRAGGGGDLSAGAKSFDLARLATSARDVSEDDSIRAIEFWPPPTPPAGVPVSAAVATRSPLAIAYEDHPATLDNRDRDSFTRIDVRSIAPPPSRVYTVSELRAGKDLV